MAKAEKMTIRRRRVEKQPGIRLELTEGDADFLLALLSSSYGDVKLSPNKYGKRIYDALKNVMGIEPVETDAHKLHAHGAVYWDDYPNPDAGQMPRISFYTDADAAKAIPGYVDGNFWDRVAIDIERHDPDPFSGADQYHWEYDPVKDVWTGTWKGPKG